jgi:hypothetical protein
LSLWWQEYRTGPGGVAQLKGSPDEVTAASTIGRLRKIVSSMGPRDDAVLIVITRTGAVSFEFAHSKMRRTAMNSDEGARMLAQLPPAIAPTLRRRTAAPKAQPQDPPDLTTQPVPQTPGMGGQHDGLQLEPLRPLPKDVAEILSPARASLLWSAIGLVGPDGQVKRDQRRKHNQIVHLIGLVADVFATLPRDRQLNVVDWGCGKSQMLCVLNHFLTEGLSMRVQFHGLDISQQAVDSARALQTRLGYNNMAFHVASIRSWQPPRPLDVVLSLHACDTATDEAIALGIAAKASAIVAVPCCQAELARQVESQPLGRVFAHGTLRRRFGDWATDALRTLYLETNGYGVDVLEYVSPLDTPKNIMLRARRASVTGLQRQEARSAFDAICAQFNLEPSLTRLRDDLETRLRAL